VSDLRELVVRWQRGWAVARELPAATDVGDGLRTHCRQPGRDVEYVALAADAAPASVSALAARVADPATWLTVPTTDPARAAGLLEAAGLVLLQRAETLMTTDLRDHPRFAVATGYTLQTRRTGAVVTATATDAAGDRGARGTMGLSGPDAVADRIETLPAHRRRGLASAVMGALAAAAVPAGATRGILIASQEGRPVYEKLGWRPVATVLIATRPS
jgi:GNAT superfamily N-acetyltransferase